MCWKAAGACVREQLGYKCLTPRFKGVVAGDKQDGLVLSEDPKKCSRGESHGDARGMGRAGTRSVSPRSVPALALCIWEAFPCFH